MSSEIAGQIELSGALDRYGEGRRGMSEREFQLFYAETCRGLRAYLRRSTGDVATAEDLFQEAYYRYLRAANPPRDPEKRRGYLFRIAMNLVTDFHRASGRNREVQGASVEAVNEGKDVGLQADVAEALRTLKPVERTRLWLAYVNGSSHREIAAATGVKEASVRPLLLRARRKLASLLRKRGLEAATRPEVEG